MLAKHIRFKSVYLLPMLLMQIVEYKLKHIISKQASSYSYAQILYKYHIINNYPNVQFVLWLMQSGSSWLFILLLQSDFFWWNLWLHISMVTLEEGMEGAHGKERKDVARRKTRNLEKQPTKKWKESKLLLEETRPIRPK